MRLGYLAVIVAVPLVALGMHVRREDLVARHRKLQETIGIPRSIVRSINTAQRGLDGLIATDYYLALPWLPGLAEYGLRGAAATPEAFRLAYDRPDVKYALVYKNNPYPQVRQYLEAACAAGRSELLFDLKVYRFYAKKESR